MKRLPLILLAFAVLVFSACQKDVDGKIDGATGSTKYISKIIQTDKDYPGEAYVLAFEYDAQKRCTKVDELYLDTVAGVAQITDQYNYVFHYNGSDTKASKVTNPALPTWAWYFMYDGQGKKVMDSIVDGSDLSLSLYRYTSDKIYAELSGVFINGAPELIFRDTLLHNGNNITKQILTKRESGLLLYWYETNYTFDNKHNPLYDLNIASTFFASIAKEFPLYLGLNKNNALTETEKDLMGPYFGGVTLTYTYDSDDYPVKATGVYTWDPNSKVTVRYEYLP